MKDLTKLTQEEFSELMIKNFPDIYIRERESEYELPTPFELFYFETGDGWNNLLYKLSEDIKTYCDDHKLKLPIALQVKSKFGGLIFYINETTKEVYDIITKAENDSFNICEKCGSTEDVTCKGSWITTLCKKCRE